MKKIIFLFIVFLAFFHPATKAAKDAKHTSFLTHVSITPNFDQSSNQTDFVGTDLLELTEDDISHFEKKFIAGLKSVCTNSNILIPISLTTLNLQSNSNRPFLGRPSSIHALIGVFRI